MSPTYRRQRGARAVLLSAAAVLLAAASLISSGSAAPNDGRVSLRLNVGKNKYFTLRLPRAKPLPPGADGGFTRTYNDTCGLFDILYSAKGPAGAGPPPHIHYADDEWFFLAGTGTVRMYTHQKATTFVPGFLPGFNTPPVLAGSAVLQNDTLQALYSPRGSVHWFNRETETTDFYAVHASGHAMELIIDAFNTMTDPKELLSYTGLYGAPHDLTGRFVGLDKCGDKCYRSARGPVDVPSVVPSLRKLQKLFDLAEKKKCWTP